MFEQRKLEDLQSVLRRKEREFEATLEHFQTDVESLQMERGELKDKLLSVTKERFSITTSFTEQSTNSIHIVCQK